MQKGFSPVVVIILALVLIAGGVAGYIILSKQKLPVSAPPLPIITSDQTSQEPQASPVDETAAWKTYADSKYEFSFKYPQNYHFADYSGCTNELYGVSIGTKKDISFCDPELTLVLVQKDKMKNCSAEGSKGVLSRKEVKVANQTAQRVVIENPRQNNKNETLVQFLYKDNCFVISNRDNKIEQNIFDTILASFKFLE